MKWETEDRVEWAVDVAAAAIFAVAVGYSLWAFAPASGVLGAAAAFLAAHFGLRRVLPGERAYALSPFPEPAFESWADPPEELILEDELDEVGPNSRVVRLFGASQNHLPSRAAPPDASEALIEALAELRRSLH
ncbi:MAG: hypothetical protein ABIS66_08115 [Sphingomicrobium sp.]